MLASAVLAGAVQEVGVADLSCTATALQAEAQVASLGGERDALAAELAAAASRAAEVEGAAQAAAQTQARQQEAGAAALAALAALAAELEGQRQRAVALEGHLAALQAQRAEQEMREAELRALVQIHQQREEVGRARWVAGARDACT